ncbi:MAG: cytochrome [Rhodospirillales bacterium]|nr:cytochrome [Rhodospirillales bacterium]
MTTVEFDPFDYRYHDDPYPIYKQLRDEAPLYWNEKHGFWILSRYEDCRRAIQDFKTFCNGQGQTLEPLKGQVPTVLTTDPPDHTRLRHLVVALFAPAAVASMDALVRDLARELLAPHLVAGRIDIIADFAARLPMAIICQMLGFPREDEDQLRGWTDAVVHRDEGVFEMPEAGLQATFNLYQYYDKAIAKRAGTPPRDDVLGKLIEDEKAGKLSHEEVLGYLYILSIAGNETTTKLIGNMIYQLHHHPLQKALLFQDPSLIASAVEETMRFDGPTQMMARTVTREVEVHGQTLKPGQKIGLLFISANRDERKWPDAETYDVRRTARDHLGFGAGLHACLGAALARLEARVALEEILAGMPNFVVDESALERMHSPSVRGYTKVVLNFTPRGDVAA